MINFVSIVIRKDLIVIPRYAYMSGRTGSGESIFLERKNDHQKNGNLIFHFQELQGKWFLSLPNINL